MNPAVIFLLIWFFLMGCGNQPGSDAMMDMDKLKSLLEAKIQDSGAEVGLAFEDLETGRTILINADRMMHAASTMKVPVMIEVFKQAGENKFSLGDSLLVKNEFRSIVDDSLYSMDLGEDSDESLYELIGGKSTIRQLMFQMITVSSNLATNILIDLVDAKRVMATLAEFGINQMQVLRGVEDLKAYEQGLNNRTNAKDMMIVMEAIATNAAGNPQACSDMIDILSAQKFRDKIPAGIPGSIRVANKTGSITKIDHDAAIVFPAGRKPYVLVILTRGIEQHEAAYELIAQLSKMIYQAIVGEPTDGFSSSS